MGFSDEAAVHFPENLEVPDYYETVLAFCLRKDGYVASDNGLY